MAELGLEPVSSSSSSRAPNCDDENQFSFIMAGKNIYIYIYIYVEPMRLSKSH